MRQGTEEDLPAIRRLLHATFVEELGQYPDRGRPHHTDKFEHKNRHFLAEEDGHLVGLIAVHGEGPFSVAARLPHATPFTTLADHPLEVRLLSVVPGRRRSLIAFHLMAAVFAYAKDAGYRELWISGVEEQLPLYRKLGFEALGPAVPDGAVAFTPMRVRMEALPPHLVQRANRLFHRGFVSASRTPSQEAPLALLPGPPRLTSETLRAAARAAQAPAYHRSGGFLSQYRRVQGNLSRLMHGHAVALFPGGGTHANDVVAQALAHLPQVPERPGLILENGEFGHRLRAHADGAGLPHEVLDFGWGQPWDLARIRQFLIESKPAWVWAVHCESSAGIRNPIEELVVLIAEQEGAIPLCLDAISTLGALPLPHGTTFVSSVSGKVLLGHPGISIVGVAPDGLRRLAPSSWPPSLDLPAHAMSPTPPHTLGATVLASLDASLQGPCRPDQEQSRYQEYLRLGQWVRARLHEVGARTIAGESTASPSLTTFEVPAGLTTLEFLRLARDWGFELAGCSHYHRSRRLAQIATFGSFQTAELAPLFDRWKAWKAGFQPQKENLYFEA